jgi:hypothetical protein
MYSYENHLEFRHPRLQITSFSSTCRVRLTLDNYHPAICAPPFPPRYGVGVGGEYPLASASAAERANSADHLRAHRGRQVSCYHGGPCLQVVGCRFRHNGTLRAGITIVYFCLCLSVQVVLVFSNQGMGERRLLAVHLNNDAGAPVPLLSAP